MAQRLLGVSFPVLQSREDRIHGQALLNALVMNTLTERVMHVSWNIFLTGCPHGDDIDCLPLLFKVSGLLLFRLIVYPSMLDISLSFSAVPWYEKSGKHYWGYWKIVVALSLLNCPPSSSNSLLHTACLNEPVLSHHLPESILYYNPEILDCGLGWDTLSTLTASKANFPCLMWEIYDMWPVLI